jgi:hypothetical protein
MGSNPRGLQRRSRESRAKRINWRKDFDRMSETPMTTAADATTIDKSCAPCARVTLDDVRNAERAVREADAALLKAGRAWAYAHGHDAARRADLERELRNAVVHRDAMGIALHAAEVARA